MSGIVAQNTLDNTGLIKSPEGGGAWTFISKVTSDGSDSSLSFTSGIDSTYKEYVFYLVNIHPETDNAELTFNVSIDTGSNYNVAKTTTSFYAYHFEDDSATSLAYDTGHDLAQGTGYQYLLENCGNDNDQASSGYLHFFDPASTTFQKHFTARMCNGHGSSIIVDEFVAGYGNTTSAVDAVDFKYNSGEIQAGEIFLYGLTI